MLQPAGRSSCAITGPGVESLTASGTFFDSFFTHIVLLLWLQGLLYAVFLLLPYSGKFNVHTGRVSYERATSLRKEAEEMVKCQAAVRVRLRRSAHIRSHRRSASATKQADTPSARRASWQPLFIPGLHDRTRICELLPTLSDPSSNVAPLCWSHVSFPPPMPSSAALARARTFRSAIW